MEATGSSGGNTAAMVIVLPLLGYLILFLSPSTTTAVLALIACAAAAFFALKKVFGDRAWAYLFGVAWALVCALLPLFIALFSIGGLGTGRW